MIFSKWLELTFCKISDLAQTDVERKLEQEPRVETNNEPELQQSSNKELYQDLVEEDMHGSLDENEIINKNLDKERAMESQKPIQCSDNSQPNQPFDNQDDQNNEQGLQEPATGNLIQGYFLND